LIHATPKRRRAFGRERILWHRADRTRDTLKNKRGSIFLCQIYKIENYAESDAGFLATASSLDGAGPASWRA